MANFRNIKTTIKQFKNVEDGLALTEYLLLLGIIAGGLIAILGLYGADLNGAWTNLTETVFNSEGLHPQSSNSTHD